MQQLISFGELAAEGLHNERVGDSEGVTLAFEEISRLAQVKPTLYVLTRLVASDEVPIAGLYATPEAAMLAHNRMYFGDDLGVHFSMLEGWSRSEVFAKASPEDAGPSQNVWVFDDEGDPVYIVGLEVSL